MTSKATIQELSFFATVVLVTAAFIWLLMPYYGAVLWAVILAILFKPLQSKLARLLPARHNLVAALSVLACVCIVVIPGSIILALLAQEATGLYNRISTQDFDLGAVLAQIRSASPPFVLNSLSAMGISDWTEIQARLTSFLLQVSQTIATQAVTIGQSTAQFMIGLGIMLYLLFFLFRDEASLMAVIRRGSPLSERHTDHILAKFTSVVKATVTGNIVIAVVQGAIGGIAFSMIGIDAALFWGVLMAVLSLLPAVGATLVWGPATAYLLLSGAYLKGAILLVIGALVISTVDNLLRPPLVGKGIHLPDYVVLVSTVGGLSLIGMNGFIIGPLIAALFISVWSLWVGDQPQ